MDTLQVLGSAMGLGLLAGIRLYATVFALGLAIRLGWFSLNPTFAHLDVLAQTPVLLVSGLAFAIEFLADKVPWLDSLWDSVHTFIRPVGAAALGATALGTFDPTTQWLVALLCGGVAFTGHTSKAATRLVANHSPEPLTNIGLSVAEDLMIPAGLWIAFEHPLVAMTAVGIFLVLFFWLSPKVFRLLQVSWTALRSLLERWFAGALPSVQPALPQNAVGRQFAALPFRALPVRYAQKLEGDAFVGVHCVAGRGVRGLKNSIGFLCPTSDGLVFVARRMFVFRTYKIRWANVQSLSLKRGILLDSLAIVTSDQEVAFDLFKAKTSTATAPAWQEPVKKFNLP